MRNHRVVAADESGESTKSSVGSRFFGTEVQPILSGISFAAFPIALNEFGQIESSRQLVAISLAFALWMVVILIGLRSVSDIFIEQKDVAAVRRIRLLGLLQIGLFTAGVVVLCSPSAVAFVFCP